MKKNLRVAMHLLLAAVMCVAACGGSEPQYRSGTWAIDCVAVVGMPVSALTPLSAVPYSGVPREKLIKELTDEEIGRFSDFVQCLGGNGYHFVCVKARDNRVEGPEVLTDYLGTCFRTPFPYLGPGGGTETREEVVRFFREYYGSCGVGIYEDCNREAAVGEFPVADTPSCTAWEQSCID
ncbi:MAG: hypothetical protein FWD69_17855 [Polyangiaceae bacterium]|nr:hypothetical protein [Polyangiaceae bacterium]